EPDKNTLVIVSLPLPPGRPPLLTVRWPGATGLTSYLSGCFLLTSRRCRLQHRRRFRKFIGFCQTKRALPDSDCFPSRANTLSRLSTPLVQRIPLWNPSSSLVPCWCAVATICLQVTAIHSSL